MTGSFKPFEPLNPSSELADRFKRLLAGERPPSLLSMLPTLPRLPREGAERQSKANDSPSKCFISISVSSDDMLDREPGVRRLPRGDDFNVVAAGLMAVCVDPERASSTDRRPPRLWDTERLQEEAV